MYTAHNGYEQVQEHEHTLQHWGLTRQLRCSGLWKSTWGALEQDAQVSGCTWGYKIVFRQKHQRTRRTVKHTQRARRERTFWYEQAVAHFTRHNGTSRQSHTSPDISHEQAVAHFTRHNPRAGSRARHQTYPTSRQSRTSPDISHERSTACTRTGCITGHTISISRSRRCISSSLGRSRFGIQPEGWNKHIHSKRHPHLERTGHCGI